jgi:hypothetical protein
MFSYYYKLNKKAKETEKQVWGGNFQIITVSALGEKLMEEEAGLSLEQILQVEEGGTEIKGHEEYDEYGFGDEAYNELISIFCLVLDCEKKDIEAYMVRLLLQVGVGEKWRYRLRQTIKDWTFSKNYRVWFSDFIRAVSNRHDTRESLKEALMQAIENIDLQRKFLLFGDAGHGESFYTQRARLNYLLKKRNKYLLAGLGELAFYRLRKERKKEEPEKRGGARIYSFYYSVSSGSYIECSNGLNYYYAGSTYSFGVSCKDCIGYTGLLHA